ncbi:MAG: hypothetical protein U0841_30655 [Chloroflexia bacterium]
MTPLRWRLKSLLMACLGILLTACSPDSSTPAPTLSPSATLPAATATVTPPRIALATSTAAPPTFPPTIPPLALITVGPTATPTPIPPRPEDWAALHRPLALPAMSLGASCPLTPGASISPHFGPGLGVGPAYPIMSNDAIYHYSVAQPTRDGWVELKVLWVSAPTYSGPLLVRGHRIDGPQSLLLTTSATGGSVSPQEELRLFASNTSPLAGWRNWPSYTLVQAPGCYAYQVDGTTFSYTIVFLVVQDTP